MADEIMYKNCACCDKEGKIEKDIGLYTIRVEQTGAEMDIFLCKHCATTDNGDVN